MLYSLSVWMILLSSHTFALPNGYSMLNEGTSDTSDSLLIIDTLKNFLEGSAFSGDFAGRVRAALVSKLTEGFGGGFNGNFMAKGGGNLGTILNGSFDVGGRGRGSFGFGDKYRGGLKIDLPPPKNRQVGENPGQFGTGKWVNLKNGRNVAKAPQEHSQLLTKGDLKRSKSTDRRSDPEPPMEEPQAKEPVAEPIYDQPAADGGPSPSAPEQVAEYAEPAPEQSGSGSTQFGTARLVYE
ncbi:hypothetical protein K493DRAFT_365930 [Basidiobolus meristosporus CBS 931.73]|uniref:Uncharacterized protein n=1 Tax=Basidiobolus meristosporus CBS 931.73 TaxID=1314790 RepID=A0A1Y1WQ35_9FUNG|nr:hypothetical protein K493DRAFT_365930 [Basidiobolus meristosporus CBS 931.73]|eukprot:ORX75376.1 hypothetical protein K493DRAFT_365930 [Basidiobolus meristosporus CBS 931.73]